MFLNCCHRRIPVRIGHNLRDDAGNAALALFVPSPLTILLDISCPPADRRETIVHELGHAFDHIVGAADPGDKESLQNRTAAIESQFAHDLETQGGEKVIHAMFGDEGVYPSLDGDAGETMVILDESAAEWPTKIACPSCHHQHSSGFVRNGTPAFNPRLNSFVRWRVMPCSNCAKEFRWLQRCNWEGLPLPDVVVPPTVRTLQNISA